MFERVLFCMIIMLKGVIYFLEEVIIRAEKFGKGIGNQSHIVSRVTLHSLKPLSGFFPRME